MMQHILAVTKQLYRGVLIPMLYSTQYTVQPRKVLWLLREGAGQDMTGNMLHAGCKLGTICGGEHGQP